MDSAGNIYIADSDDNRIRMISATTGIINTIAGTGPHDGYSGDGGPGTNAQLSDPEGLAVDASGNVFIADTVNRVVRMLQPAAFY